MIQGIPVRPQDALYFAKQDIQHFLGTQTHLNPNQLLAEARVSVTDQKSPQTENSSYLSPEEAYKKVQAGKYSEIKNKKASGYYTWADVLNAPYGNNSPVAHGAVKSVPLSSYQNAAKLAIGLDKLSTAAGKKLTVNTWIRWNDPRHHGTGKAADIGNMSDASINYAYIRSTLMPLARRIPELSGVGYPTKDTHHSLHLDIGGHPSPIPYGQQYVFVDNGDGKYYGPIQKAIKPYL